LTSGWTLSIFSTSTTKRRKSSKHPHWDDQPCIVHTHTHTHTAHPWRSGRVHEEVPFPRKPVEPVIRMLLPLKYRTTTSESSSPIIFESASVVLVGLSNIR
jgi:hypothetical protein